MKIGTWTVPENKFADMTKLGIDYITTNSLSGNQKYAKLSYQNGFVDNQGITDASYVEELVGAESILTLMLKRVVILKTLL